MGCILNVLAYGSLATENSLTQLGTAYVTKGWCQNVVPR